MPISCSSANACAKVILFGEHSVVQGHPALSLPLHDYRLDVQVYEGEDATKNPDIINQMLERIQQEWNCQKELLKVKVKCRFPLQAGMGSSASLSIALLKALAAKYQKSLSDDDLCRLGYILEKMIHGSLSGVDHTTIIYERPLLFKKDQKVEFLNLGQEESAAHHLVILDTGVRRMTGEVLEEVKSTWQSDASGLTQLQNQIGELASAGVEAFKEGRMRDLGKLMNRNHRLLVDLGVSSPVLDDLVLAACSAGAWGAKLSGAGKGGVVIALVPTENMDEFMGHARVRMVPWYGRIGMEQFLR